MGMTKLKSTLPFSRAVHLDVAYDNSTTAFSMVFKRFMARRGRPQMIISDNGTNFQGHIHILRDFYNSTEVNEILNSSQIEWKFIPARSPWFGGFWERMIGVTKSTLRKALGKNLVTKEQLYTILTEVESFINDRPLGYVSENDTQFITPSQLILGHKLHTIPNIVSIDKDFTLDNHVVNKQFEKVTKIISEAWRAWKNIYMLNLKDIEKVNYPTKSKGLFIPNKGDVVLLMDESPRCQWLLGRILEIIEGRDGGGRVAKLKTLNGILYRPLIKLSYLESCPFSNVANDDCPPTVTAVNDKQSRKSALDARLKINTIMNCENNFEF